MSTPRLTEEARARLEDEAQFWEEHGDHIDDDGNIGLGAAMRMLLDWYDRWVEESE